MPSPIYKTEDGFEMIVAVRLSTRFLAGAALYLKSKGVEPIDEKAIAWLAQVLLNELSGNEMPCLHSTCDYDSSVFDPGGGMRNLRDDEDDGPF